MLNFFADEERDAKRQELNDPLELLSRHIDFAGIARAVDAQLSLGPEAKGRRPAWPTEVMVRVLLLQRLCNLSDESLEYQLLDRRSFVRFVGLDDSGKVPDAKTIWVWCERLKDKDVMGDISAAISGQLARAGYIARGGKIIDASIVNVPIQHNTCEENAQIKREEIPRQWNEAKRTQKDVDSCWTSKHGSAYYGYKLHANVDRRWGRIAKDWVFDEYAFARLAQQGGKSLRTLGLARAKVVIGLKLASHNLMRLARLQEAGLVPV
ncbi:IS5/IS1182 family transposase [Xanthomonas albilineans]|uniref:IS5/IS1182 family transposase n=1 Tax=Xanthomonas albilineans TaxID=29447 RepID=UPI0005F30D30|nr:IS5/IS1182 family transposase [Xanthomonas albilineans]